MKIKGDEAKSLVKEQEKQKRIKNKQREEEQHETAVVKTERFKNKWNQSYEVCTRASGSMFVRWF